MALSKWTQEEIEFLKNNSKMLEAELSKKIKKGRTNIQLKKKELGLNGTKPRWEEEEIEFLKQNYLTMTCTEMAKHLKNRNADTIGIKRRELGLYVKNDPKWTQKDIEFLKNNFSTLSVEELSKKLNLPYESVRHKISKLQTNSELPLKAFPTSKEEIDYLKELLEEIGFINDELVEKFNLKFPLKPRSKKSLRYLENKLVKNKEFNRRSHFHYRLEGDCTLFGDVLMVKKKNSSLHRKHYTMKHWIRKDYLVWLEHTGEDLNGSKEKNDVTLAHLDGDPYNCEISNLVKTHTSVVQSLKKHNIYALGPDYVRDYIEIREEHYELNKLKKEMKQGEKK